VCRPSALPRLSLAALVFALLVDPSHAFAQRERVAAQPVAQTQAAASATVAQATEPARAPGAALSPRNANYSIDVRLEPSRRTLSGSEVITWRNITSAPTKELRLHLYYNGWRNSASTWMRERLISGGGGLLDREPGEWGWSDVRAIRLVGSGSAPPIDLLPGSRFIAPDDGNPEDRTLMAVPLPRPVGPGETINVSIEWTAQVPRTFSRTGVLGEYFFIAQWFPKVAVLQDSGWNSHQFHSATEFFADFGVYDVRMTVPREWILGATGHEAGPPRDNADGTRTHHYVEEDVHDFAWTTSPRFREMRETFDHPTLPKVEMRLLLQPEHVGLSGRYFTAARAALRYYGEWFGAYPYGHLTVVDPAWQSATGGMEYPTLVTGNARWLSPRLVSEPESVTVHEVGHQFWYGIVASNEFEHAWLDEGLNSFAAARALEQVLPQRHHSQRFFGGFVPWVYRDIRLSREIDGNRLHRYRPDARTDSQATPTFRYWPATANRISYDKTALWLATLERHLGWATLQRIMSTYFERWRFRHPVPDDFFTVANEVSGRDLTSFFDEVYRSSNVFDYGIQDLVSQPATTRGFIEAGGRLQYSNAARDDKLFRTSVVVRRYGEAIFPVDVLVVFSDGENVREHWDGRERWRMYTYDRPSRAAYAQVDPERVLLLDVNYTNNSRSLTPLARTAARKWAYKWMVWLQDVLLTYAFFV
jgi:hypothetical protein